VTAVPPFVELCAPNLKRWLSAAIGNGPIFPPWLTVVD
jgi:hypothetical protein